MILSLPTGWPPIPVKISIEFNSNFLQSSCWAQGWCTDCVVGNVRVHLGLARWPVRETGRPFPRTRAAGLRGKLIGQLIAVQFV